MEWEYNYYLVIKGWIESVSDEDCDAGLDSRDYVISDLSTRISEGGCEDWNVSNVSDFLSDNGMDVLSFDYAGFDKFLVEFLHELGENIEIEEIEFNPVSWVEGGGFDYEATLKYKIGDLISKWKGDTENG